MCQYHNHYGGHEQTLYKSAEATFAKARLSEIHSDILEESKKSALSVAISNIFWKAR
jgi:hypothetical protein